MSIVKWLIQGAMIYMSLHSFRLYVTPAVALIVMSVTALGVAVPSVPGFFGVVQLCFWKTLEPLGMNQADVFAASVYYLLAQYVPVTLIGLYFLNNLHLRLGDIRARRRDGEPSRGLRIARKITSPRNSSPSGERLRRGSTKPGSYFACDPNWTAWGQALPLHFAATPFCALSDGASRSLQWSVG